MAGETAPIPVVSQGYAAVVAALRVTTGAAEKGTGIASTIEQHEDLLLPLEALLDSIGQRIRAEFLPAVFLKLDAHVDDVDRGKRALADPGAERLVARSPPLPRVVVGFQLGCRTSQNHQGTFLLRSLQSDVSGVVTGRFFLLVGGILYLIHDNRAEVLEGGKDR